TTEQRHEPLEGERVLDAGLLRLATDVVAVVEHDAPVAEEIEHRAHVDRDRLPGLPKVLVRTVRSEFRRLPDGEPARDVPAERVVGARLVGYDVGPDASLYEFRMDLGTVPDEADRQRPPARFRVKRHLERFVELVDDAIAVSVGDAPLNPGFVNLDIEAHALVHLDRERLRTSHAAHAARQYEAPCQGAAEVLPRARRERLVGALDDSLGPDVRPPARGTLAVHREAELLELVERLQ